MQFESKRDILNISSEQRAFLSPRPSKEGGRDSPCRCRRDREPLRRRGAGYRRRGDVHTPPSAPQPPRWLSLSSPKVASSCAPGAPTPGPRPVEVGAPWPRPADGDPPPGRDDGPHRCRSSRPGVAAATSLPRPASCLRRRGDRGLWTPGRWPNLPLRFCGETPGGPGTPTVWPATSFPGWSPTGLRAHAACRSSPYSAAGRTLLWALILKLVAGTISRARCDPWPLRSAGVSCDPCGRPPDASGGRSTPST